MAFNVKTKTKPRSTSRRFLPQVPTRLFSIFFLPPDLHNSSNTRFVCPRFTVPNLRSSVFLESAPMAQNQGAQKDKPPLSFDDFIQKGNLRDLLYVLQNTDVT
jgi:hypothetical protein